MSEIDDLRNELVKVTAERDLARGQLNFSEKLRLHYLRDNERLVRLNLEMASTLEWYERQRKRA